jgi:hypothetical protein
MTKTAAEIRQEIEKRSRSGGGKGSWFSMKPGDKKYLRLGRPWRKNGDFWKDVFIHGYFKDKVFCRSNEKNPATGKPRKCPVCQRLKEMESDRSTKAKKLWGLIKQNSEGLWNVLVAKKIIRKDNGKIIVKKYEDNKFKLFRLSPRWNNLMMDIFGDEDYRVKSILGVTHPLSGRLIKATRTGKGREDTTYAFAPVDRSTPIFDDEEKRKKIGETLIDLDKAVKISSKEECEAFLEKMEKKARKLAKLEKEDAGDDDEDDDVKDEEDDEEDDDDTDDDEDSDDDDDLESRYKKAKKNAAKKKKKHRDDEDDEDDE